MQSGKFNWLSLFLIILFCLPITLFSQSNEEVQAYIFVDFPESKIKIDDGDWIIPSTNKIRGIILSSGSHKLKIWAPKMQLVDTSFYVVVDGTNTFRYSMKYDPEYLKFIEESDKFKRTNLRYNLLGPAIQVGILGTAIGMNAYSGKSKNDALNIQEQYAASLSSSEIEKLKDDYDKKVSHYKIFRNASYVMFGVSAYSIYKFIQRSKIRKEEPEPVYIQKEMETSMYIDVKYKDDSFGVGLIIKF